MTIGIVWQLFANVGWHCGLTLRDLAFKFISGNDTPPTPHCDLTEFGLGLSRLCASDIINICQVKGCYLQISEVGNWLQACVLVVEYQSGRISKKIYEKKCPTKKNITNLILTLILSCRFVF